MTGTCGSGRASRCCLLESMPCTCGMCAWAQVAPQQITRHQFWHTQDSVWHTASLLLIKSRTGHVHCAQVQSVVQTAMFEKMYSERDVLLKPLRCPPNTQRCTAAAPELHIAPLWERKGHYLSKP